MATKSDRPGLLSKMALFVRNPTKDWSDLDKPVPAAESGYDKHALKAMIERKRQNDFVRRREFDQLRKLRIRDSEGKGGVVRPSIFQTSMTTDPDGRAVTLKKIDEIEAQMSKQWWKGKQDAAAGAANVLAAARPTAIEGQTAAGADAAAVTTKHFETTQAEVLQVGATEFVETEMGHGMAHISAPAPPVGARHGVAASILDVLADRSEVPDMGFSTSRLFAAEAGDMATDPELEEAAIRFANGDDTGAENGLLQALRGDAIQPDVALSWACALLDFYRATNNRPRFDSAVLEFAMRFDRVRPAWSNLQDSLPAGGGVAAPAPAHGVPPGANSSVRSDALWDCPPELNAQAMEQLREVMGAHPMPWHLEWSRLARISTDAMPLLAGLFSSLCDEPVVLSFSGSNTLEQILRAMMPSGDRSIDPVWWTVRLNALRTMQMQDEFELGALDYCVTYEVSPPAWEPARCQFQHVNAIQGGQVHPVPAERGLGFSQAATSPVGLDGAPAITLELRGDVLGDATQALAFANGAPHGGDRIVVSCQGLVRVDFSAAGSILNWVALRQTEGCQVQFQNVHRLVAAFFNVIGINEHARVLPRPI
ncbi:MAG: hypothetical protein A3F78_06240 [Burkholderiales bacterium RIFCSPLOWO2_12_FULL_61_40]|nr:MAG: hypothetical protein A3F78_06240 [Burkholderiales bacterium RIFCSPLOWO2_12_FULL_61_40]